MIDRSMPEHEDFVYESQTPNAPEGRIKKRGGIQMEMLSIFHRV